MKVSLNNPVKCSDGAEIPPGGGGLQYDLHPSALFAHLAPPSPDILSSHPLGKLAIRGLVDITSQCLWRLELMREGEGWACHSRRLTLTFQTARLVTDRLLSDLFWHAAFHLPPLSPLSAALVNIVR